MLMRKDSLLKDTQHLELSSYQKVNNSFRRRLIYHVGINCGFFVELNYMLNAMLYSLDHELQFQLYTEDSNFGTGIGWTEYFAPFCEEVHDSFHRKYNFHRTPTWRRILKNAIRKKSPGFIFWKLKFMLKSLQGHWLAFRTYGEYVRLNQDVATDPATHYNIPALGINCSYYEAYAMLARMIWKLRPEIVKQITDAKIRFSLPQVYAGVQIRGGDKATETQLISGRRVVETLQPENGECVFALADDYRELERVRSVFPQLRIVSLCRPGEEGYYHQQFSALDPQEKKAGIIRLLVSVDIMLHAHKFSGSITTGPSVFIMKQRLSDANVQAVDCAKEQFSSVLTLTIDRRANISAEYLAQTASPPPKPPPLPYISPPL